MRGVWVSSKYVPKAGDLVHVEWEDATATANWLSPHDAAGLENMKVNTVGFMVDRNSKRIVLSGSRGKFSTGEEIVSEVTTIPTNWVTRVRRLK